jgi:hypothetical protein
MCGIGDNGEVSEAGTPSFETLGSMALDAWIHKANQISMSRRNVKPCAIVPLSRSGAPLLSPWETETMYEAMPTMPFEERSVEFY